MGVKPIKDLTGQKFGRLTVIKMADYRKKGRVTWVCQCDCGNIVDMPGINLTKTNGTKSCGCICKKHGMFGTRIYNVWHTMKERCYVKSQISYPNYGGRGIKVCDEWQEFIPFMEWAYANGYDENAPRGQCTLDRIDPNGNYEPNNCRWVNTSIQANNRNTNVFIEYNGKIDTLSNHARENGISPVLAETRKINGDSVERIFRPKREPNKIFYKGKYMTVSEIAKMSGISRSPIERRVLKNGENIEYVIADIISKPRKKLIRNRNVFQYTKNMDFIKKWKNLSEIEKELNFKRNAVSRCCVGHSKTAYGYIWSYEEKAL